MDRKDFTNHISEALNQSLEDVFDHILQMGGMVEKQINCVVEALQKDDVALAKEILALDKEVNQQEVAIDSLCARILARQQPTALDLRLVLSAIRMAVDLERIGDEVVKVAKFVLMISEENLSCSQIPGVESLIEISMRSAKMLHTALDAFARLSINEVAEVIEEEERLDTLYKEVMHNLMPQLDQGCEDSICSLNLIELIFALRAAERMSDHARNLVESIVYLVEGQDVRDMVEAEVYALLKNKIEVEQSDMA